MKFTVARDALITPLNQVAGVVERRQTLPILANVLMVLEGERLSLTGTDLEVELIGRVAVASADGDGEGELDEVRLDTGLVKYVRKESSFSHSF